MVGQRMDLFFDDFGQNTRGRRIVADVVEKYRLLKSLMQDTVNILDGLAAESRLSIMSLRQLVV